MTPAFSAIRATVAFYSRLPVPYPQGVSLARSVWVLPVAGALIALGPALLGALGLWFGLSSFAAAFITVMGLVIVTGALHEDGLADCCDGFWGGSTLSRRLEIMADSRIGTYGVLGLVGAVGLKVALLADLVTALGGWALPVFAAAAAAARAVALFPWAGLPNARPGGLAATMGRPSAREFRAAIFIAIGVTAVLTLLISPLGFFLGAMAAAAAAKGVASLADSKIRGHTGDVIGAAVVMADLSYLAAFTISLP
ncbi:adenosylcobinamide-GDP ribazoletransferase [Acuticoccus yangtzensis]|uniref:adenosylcobinamide-GDP ribazoletransferase n=1 Tax=Acuticoccus yangtzensis TaxID=1443441 RepID=UPI000949ABA5|nr:adenosylcobinamide-GDP ribazoletransferase [Acuticoccus yangtzensis]